MEEVVAEPFEPTRARVGLGALERDRHRAADPIHAWGWKGVPYVSYQYRVFWRFGPDILSWNLHKDGTKILYEIVVILRSTLRSIGMSSSPVRTYHGSLSKRHGGA